MVQLCYEGYLPNLFAEIEGSCISFKLELISNSSIIVLTMVSRKQKLYIVLIF